MVTRLRRAGRALGGERARVPLRPELASGVTQPVAGRFGPSTAWIVVITAGLPAAATGQNIGIVVGPVALFPLWGVSLAVATLGDYFRRRGPCRVCGRGAPASPHPRQDGL